MKTVRLWLCALLCLTTSLQALAGVTMGMHCQPPAAVVSEHAIHDGHHHLSEAPASKPINACSCADHCAVTALPSAEPSQSPLPPTSFLHQASLPDYTDTLLSLPLRPPIRHAA